MSKHVITTVQTVVSKYYVEADKAEYAYDAIVCGELECFSSKTMTEDIVDSQEVEHFPMVPAMEVNAAVYKFNNDTNLWEEDVRWDLAKK